MTGLYRALLRLYPHHFRERFGAAMRYGFEKDLVAARERGRVASAWFVWSTLASTVYHGLSERHGDWRRSGSDGSGTGRLTRQGGGEMMEMVGREVRQAVRRLLRRPVFAGTALVTIALGVGATTAIFSVVETVLLRALPYEQGDRLVMIGHESLTDRLGMPDGGFLHYSARSRTLEEVGLWIESSGPVVGLGEPVELGQIIASNSLLPTLGVEPVLGRGFVPEDHAAGADPVVIVSHGFWTRHLGADPDAIGEPMLPGSSQTVVGVLPEGFDFLRPEALVVFGNRFDAPDVYYPLSELDPGTARFGNFMYHGVGRLAAGATVEDAQIELDRLMVEAAEAYPGGLTVAQLTEGQFRPRVEALKTELVGDLAGVLWLLAGAVGFVLLIALANVANLFLVRAETRVEELSLRRALGASRGAVRLAYLSESMILSSSGGILGVCLASLATPPLLRLVPGDVPRLDLVGLNGGVALFALGVSLAVGIALGSLPALRAPEGDLRHGLGEGTRGGVGRRRMRLRSFLVSTQVAFALVLLVGSALLYGSFRNLEGVDPGFDTTDALTFRLPLSGSVLRAAGYADGPADARRSAFMLDLTERLETIPGVQRVAFSADLPLDGDEWHDDVALEEAWPAPGDTRPLKVLRVFGGPGYLEAIGATMRLGRDLERSDFAEQPRVVVVNEAFAAQRWPGQDPLGRRLAQYGPGLSPDGDIFYTVVGVVADVREATLMTAPEPTVYLPTVFLPEGNFSMWVSNMVVVVRTDSDPRALLPRVREEVSAFQADVPMNNIATLEEITAESFGQVSFTMTLIALASVVSLLLGVVGVYGAVSYIVAQRMQEFGVRIALGASARAVAAGVLRYATRMGIVGVALGLIVSVAVARVMESLLYGVSARDPLVFVLVAVTLFGVVLVASLAPARRAARIDPVTAMRD